MDVNVSITGQHLSVSVFCPRVQSDGIPARFIVAKLDLGIPLNKIKNPVTKMMSVYFKPSLNYVVVQILHWDLKKFTRVSWLLSSSMKGVGEVMSMSIGHMFEELIQKDILVKMPSFLGLQRYVCSPFSVNVPFPDA
jgi:carbamoylphosphate synthase large subunit